MKEARGPEAARREAERLIRKRRRREEAAEQRRSERDRNRYLMNASKSF